MKFRKYSYIVLAIIIATMSGFNPLTEPLIEKLKRALFTYRQMYPEEKVYVQLDKTFYKPGEDIWFNTFLLNGTTHKPSYVSDVVYVDLKDPKGNTVKTLELFVQNGTVQGDFHLDEAAPGGLYTLTAYTRWMQNFGEDTYFKKELTVQKVITPRLLLKLDFEKEAYGRGDDVVATLTAKDLKNQPLRNASIQSVVRISGETLLEKIFTTDNEGKAHVQFTLPSTLSTTDGILQNVVTSGGLQESITRSVPIVLNNITLRFFPEGGDMVAGMTSRVAFQALNEFGKGADIAGTIYDNDNLAVTTFSSFHMGMGAFTFTPAPGKKYHARISSPAGNETATALPEVQSTGYTLSLHQEQDKTLKMNIAASDHSILFLVGQSHGEIQYAEKITVRRGDNAVSVSPAKFPAGVAVFTLFNAEGLEEAERLAFLNPDKQLNISLTTSKKEYTPGEKVNLAVRTTDENGKPTPAKLSLSVVDDQLLTFADDKQDNILSWLLLSSEVKGTIQEPSFYFNPEEPKAREALDYLLMTQGWRRFTWKEVLKADKSIVYTPENNSTLSGVTRNNQSKLTQTDVVLMELGHRRRLAKVKTTSSGQFIFKNVDASIPLLLLTRQPNKLDVSARVNSATPVPTVSLLPMPGRETIVAVAEENPPKDKDVTNELPAAGNIDMDIRMEGDVASLSEVVVIGYGVQEKGLLCGAAVYSVYHDDLGRIAAGSTLETVLQGRVAGLQVQSQPINPATPATIQIRGINSLATARNAPLYVVNGQPIGHNLNLNFANGGLVNIDDIETITVLNSPEASAIFGSAASNGVIQITTKTNPGYHNFKEKKRKPTFNSVVVYPRVFSSAREFYAAPPSKKTEERKDFRTTVYWNHTVVTNDDGMATLSFYNNDAVSGFRITAEGVSASGLIGRKEEVYATQLPLTMDAKMPQFLGFEDTLAIPLTIKNSTHEIIRGTITVTLPYGLSAIDKTELTLSIAPNQTENRRIRVVSRHIAGEFDVTIKIKTDDYADQINQTIQVHPIGFPVRLSFSGREAARNVQFDIRDVEQGSLTGEASVFTDVLGDLFSGAESILREPHGCFEQVSSSTFPNILALQFLQKSGQNNPAAEKRAMQYIDTGYKKLIAYEIKGGGFDWFGSPPAHEALSAYGLVEFHQMKKVYTGVNDDMINRTRKWLLSRRKGDGTYDQQTRGLDDFSKPSGNVTNAYITYALSETGTDNLEKEYAHAWNEAWKKNDMYLLALTANTAHNLGKQKDYEELIQHFAKQVKSSQDGMLPADHSIVWSQGTSLAQETLALWALALMKSSQPDIDLLSTSIKSISAKRSFGMFGSTQATVLSLQALTEYAQFTRATRGSGIVTLSLNQGASEKQEYTAQTKNKLSMNTFVPQLREGKNTLDLTFSNAATALPYSVNIGWNTKTPASSNKCKLRIETVLAKKIVRQHETVRLTTTIQNTTQQGVPMSMAVIGIPAGLSAQPWQLKELQEKGVFDFYEILGDRLALYYRQLEASKTRTIQLDLKAEVPGTFTGVASSAYLYYTDEHKYWVKGSTIVVQ